MKRGELNLFSKTPRQLGTRMIRKENGEYVVYSEDGKKVLGRFKSEKKAKNRIRQVEYFKHLNDKLKK